MKKITFAGILFFAVLTACSSADSSSSNSSIATYGSSEKISVGGGMSNQMTAQAIPAERMSAQKISLEQSEQTQIAPAAIERKIIRNADLELEADAPGDAQARITTITEAKGGFVIESNRSGSDVKTTERDTVTMTVRVPADKFDEALDEIRKTATRTISETVKGQDVTEEFIDIEARLKSQKALEAQFLEIMKRSNSVTEALSIQREIADVRGEIEKVEGRKQFLQNQSSLSTVEIKIQSPTAFAANSSGFFYRIGESFGDGFDAALGFILVLITVVVALLPFLIFIVLPIYLVVRYFLMRNRKRRLASEIAREEIRSE
ncbi:MAG: DUF4349 domain-containing protein [Acidobacteriota bacterium]|nr:DUF4349 domain-containing protein [Acidobacteriota bacterium]